MARPCPSKQLRSLEVRISHLRAAHLAGAPSAAAALGTASGEVGIAGHGLWTTDLWGDGTKGFSYLSCGQIWKLIPGCQSTHHWNCWHFDYRTQSAGLATWQSCCLISHAELIPAADSWGSKRKHANHHMDRSATPPQADIYVAATRSNDNETTNRWNYIVNQAVRWFQCFLSPSSLTSNPIQKSNDVGVAPRRFGHGRSVSSALAAAAGLEEGGRRVFTGDPLVSLLMPVEGGQLMDFYWVLAVFERSNTVLTINMYSPFRGCVSSS